MEPIISTVVPVTDSIITPPQRATLSENCGSSANLFTDVQDVVHDIQAKADHGTGVPTRDDIVLLLCRIGPLRIDMASKFKFLFSYPTTLTVFEVAVARWRKARNRCRQIVYRTQPNQYALDATIRHVRFVDLMDDTVTLVVGESQDELVQHPELRCYVQQCGPVASGAWLRNCLKAQSFIVPRHEDLIVYSPASFEHALYSRRSIVPTTAMISRALQTVVDNRWAP